jgi:hypothetical protein
MNITLRTLTGFDYIYELQMDEVVAAAITLAYTMADKDSEVHNQLYKEDVGSDEWYQEVEQETLKDIASADEYWPVVEEFLKLNLGEDQIEELMNVLHKAESIITSVPSFLQEQILKDLHLNLTGVVQ